MKEWIDVGLLILSVIYAIAAGLKWIADDTDAAQYFILFAIYCLILANT